MILRSTGSLLKGSFKNKPMIIRKGEILKDTIMIFIEDTTEHKSYILKAKLNAGNLTGKYKEINGTEKGIFTGRRIEVGQEYLSSPMLVPLYEYKDENGFYTYSVALAKEGMVRSEKPVCLVWKNPSSVLSLDYKAKPVQ